MSVAFKVSVLIPVYNAEAYIESCVRSLFEQSLEDIEYIFVNDCTSDKSLDILNEIMDEYPARKEQVKVISHSCNKGVASTRNTGLLYAQGEYIGWVDSDDWVEKNMFEILYLMAKQADADIVWCDYYINSPVEKICKQKTEEHTEILLDAIMREDMMAPLWNKLIKRRLFVDSGIRFLDNVNMAEDMNVVVKILQLSSVIKYIPYALYHYNADNNSSLTSRKDVGKRQCDHITSLVDAVKYLSRSYSGWITEEDMLLYKLLSKRLYLFSFDVNDFKLWAKTFPETNSYIFSCPSTKLRYKLLGWMAAHRLWLLIEIWTKMKVLIKKSMNWVEPNRRF